MGRVKDMGAADAIEREKARRAESAEIGKGLRDRIELLARDLAPGGIVEGHGYWPLNPTRADRHAGSFVIWIGGGKKGGWTEFAPPCCCGDPIDLIGYLAFGLLPPDGRKTREVWQWAREWLGMPVSRRFAAVEKKGREAAPATMKEGGGGASIDTRSPEEKQASAFAMWSKGARPVEKGDPVWTYLNVARGIPTDAFAGIGAGKFPGLIRYLPNHEYRRPGEFHGTRWPVMATGMVDYRGKVRAVHRTYLAPDGSGKAPVEKPKIMWPETRGLFMPLTRGATGKSVKEAFEAGVTDDVADRLEGIEDALCWALMKPEHRVSATGSIALLASCPAHRCIGRERWIRDNVTDPDPRAHAEKERLARDAFEKRRVHLATFRDVPVPFEVIAPPAGYGDVNDWWRGVKSE